MEMQLYIPSGIQSKYVELTNSSENPVEDIKHLCQSLVDLYSSNNVKTFWSDVDTLIAHVVMSNHLLNGIDSKALITDVENHELIFADIQSSLTDWVTGSNREQFDSSVSKYYKLTETQKDSLVQTLGVCVALLSEPKDSKKILNADAKHLYEMVQHLKHVQQNKEWIKLRLELVVDMLKESKSANQKAE